MSKTRRILIVSHHFYPSGVIGAKRMSEFVLYLMEKGLEVKVLTRVRNKKLRQAELDARVSKVDKVEIWAPPMILDRLFSIFQRENSEQKHKRRSVPEPSVTGHSSSSERRYTCREHYRAVENLFDRSKLWSVIAAILGMLLRLRRRYDVVISSGPPMSAHLAAMAIAKVHAAEWIVDFRDPWVVVGFGTPGNFPPWRVKLENTAQDACTKRCSQIICASSGIRDLVTRSQPMRAEKSTVITNGFDWRLPPKNPDGRLQLLYAGSLYYNRDPFPMMRAIAGLIAEDRIDRQKVKMIFVGYCDSFAGVSTRDWVDEHKLEDVIEIRGAVTSERLKDMIAESTVLVNFAQNQPFQIPGKTFEYIGASRYMLVITEEDSESAEVVRLAGAGIVVPPNHPERLSHVLEKFYDRFVRNRDTYVPDEELIKQFSRDAANSRLCELTLSCIEQRQAD